MRNLQDKGMYSSHLCEHSLVITLRGDYQLGKNLLSCCFIDYYLYFLIFNFFLFVHVVNVNQKLVSGGVGGGINGWL